MIKKITNNKIYGVIGVPGDRKDSVASEIGVLSSEVLDYIIIKEDRDLRGRKKGEVPVLIEKGITRNHAYKNYEIILKEEEALLKALSLAKKGEYIIVFIEN